MSKATDSYAAFTAELQLIEKGNLVPVYLIFGIEDYLKSSIVSKISNSLLSEPNDFNNVKMDHTNPKRIIDEARSLPFGGGKKIMIVNGFDKINAKGYELLDLYLKNYLTKNTCLIFLSEKIDRKRKIVKSIIKTGKLIDCSPLKPRQLTSWLEQNNTSKLSRDAIAYLVERSGSDLYSLQGELDKINLYYMDQTGKRLSIDDIEEVISGKGSYTIFNLLDAIDRGNINKALEIAGNLMDNGGHPIMIISMLARQFRIIAKARELQASGGSVKQIAQAIHKPYFIVENFLRAIKRFKREHIHSALSSLCEADLHVRTSNPRYTLESLILKLCNL